MGLTPGAPNPLAITIQDATGESDSMCEILDPTHIQLLGEEPLGVTKAQVFALIYGRQIVIGSRTIFLRRPVELD